MPANLEPRPSERICQPDFIYSGSLTWSSWDAYYENDLENEDDVDEKPIEPSELESWFDDVAAPAKTLAFLTSKSFPLSPANPSRINTSPRVLDVGTGNGSALFSLLLEGGYTGSMLGVDYSERSIALARQLKERYAQNGSPFADAGVQDNIVTSFRNISFEVFDLIQQDPKKMTWWPAAEGGFDLVLDKGTFDAISLSSETYMDTEQNERRVGQKYPPLVATLVKRGGFFLITSCNWTEEEVIRWFTSTAGMEDVFEVYHRIKYPTFEFGGQKGQGVATICFRKKSG